MLTATKIKNLKPKDKTYRVSDGDGLSLEVPIRGKKRWRFRYNFEDAFKLKSFGTFPEVTLIDARDKRSKARSDIAAGRDPFPKEIKKESVKIRTFKDIAEKYLEESDISETYITRLNKSFKADVYPVIGNMDVHAIEAADIGDIILPMMKRGAKESARKTFYSVSKVFKTTISKDLIARTNKLRKNPCADIIISDILGEKSKAHYPIITDTPGLKSLLQSIDEYKGHSSTRLALKMLSHVFTRPSNIRLATWEEIDLDGKQWIIPGTKMKTKKELIVPLSAQVIEILKEAKELNLDRLESKHGILIFPSPRSMTQPLSDMALVGGLRRMGYDKTEIVAHSFRGIFSTIAHEKGKDHAVIETQLAHSIGSNVSQAYNRAEHLDERVMLMQWWSEYLDEVKL